MSTYDICPDCRHEHLGDVARGGICAAGLDGKRACACKGEPVPDRVYWFAETLQNSGEYATHGQPGVPAAMTRDPLKAARFATRGECIDFCCGTTVRAILPPLHPVEHMFMGAPK